MTSADWVVCDDVLGPAMFESRKTDIQRLGGASFMTEFGTCYGTGNNSRGKFFKIKPKNFESQKKFWISKKI
jgi:hypothetical protein